MTVKTNKHISWLGRLFGGFFYGFFAWLPFFQCKTLAETFGISKAYKDGDSFIDKIKKAIREHWSVIFGTCVGAFFFFLIPVQWLFEGFPLGINCALLAFALIFMISEIYKFATCKVKGHYISSAVYFVVILAVFACTYFLDFGSLITEFNNRDGYVLLMLIFFVAGYFFAWAGQALGSIFLLTTLYLPFSEYMYPLTRLDGLTDNIVTVGCCFVGALLGVFIAFFVESTKGSLKREKSATNIAFSLLGIVTLALRIKEPWYTGIVTELGELFTTLSCVLAAIVIGIGVTIHVYKKANKQEMQEEYENSLVPPSEPAPMTIEEYRKSILLEKLILDENEESEEVSEETEEENEQKIIKESPKILVDYNHPEAPIGESKSEPEKEDAPKSQGIDVDRLKSLSARLNDK